MYCLEVYALISAGIFAVAGLFILVGLVAFKAQAWLQAVKKPRTHDAAIGIAVVLPNASANLKIQTNA